MITRWRTDLQARVIRLSSVTPFLLARLALLVLVLLSLAILVASISTYAAYLHMLCTPAACQNIQSDGSTLQLSHSMLQQLQGAHLSFEFYVTSIVVLHLVLASGYLVMGTILATRTPNNWIALLGAFCLVAFASFRNSTMLLTLSPALQWPVIFVSFLGEVCFYLFFYLFPSGHFIPRWTCWLWLGVIVYYSAVNFFPSAPFNPFALNSIFNPVTFLVLFGSLPVVQIYRYRRISRCSERQQTKWVAFGASVALGGLLGLTLLDVMYPSGAQNPLLLLPYQTLFTIFELLIPLSIGLAILYHRLWDIDIIISRTLVYSGLTTSVIGIYVLVVGYLGALFRTNGNLVISLLATGCVAVLFQPLRGWLQKGVNHLLYGQRDEPYAVITRMSQRLEVVLAPDAVLPTIVETVASALKLPAAMIEFACEDTFEVVASYGKPVGEMVILPLSYQGETIGQLRLAPRTPGEAFTPADRRLLDELARHAGLAAHAVRLTTDLQRSRERIVTAREEERRRLRRDLHDGLGATLAALHLQAGAVRTLMRHDLDAAETELLDLQTEIRAAVTDIRRLVYALRPPTLDELGLVEAIRQHAAQHEIARITGERAGEHDGSLRIMIEAPEQLPTVPAAVEVAAYRIVQEALTNVVRHAHARTCTVHLRLTDVLQVEVVDDGVGFPAEFHVGVGLLSMRERAAEVGGSCVVEPAEGAGTRVLVQFPLLKE